jgi:amino acid adenylation domain-containing protein/non-ribosomal peptide synthase protein (TIGR01720 family)/FkbM family methyltransferase
MMKISDQLKNREDGTDFSTTFWNDILSTQSNVFVFRSNGLQPNVNGSPVHLIRYTIDIGDYYHVLEFVKRNNSALFTYCFSSFLILLSIYTGQDELIVDTPLFKLNNLGWQQKIPIAVTVDEELTGTDFLNSINKSLGDFYKHQNFFVEAAIDNRSFKTNIFFVYDEIHSPVKSVGGYDLIVKMSSANDEISFEFKYATSVFTEQFIRQFSDHFLRVVGKLHKIKNRQLKDIELINEIEKQQILDFSRGSTVNFFKGLLLHEIIRIKAVDIPSQLAVVFGGRQLTYSDLCKKADLMTMELIAICPSLSNKRIGVLMERSDWLIISILSILQSGAVYVPINPRLPGERIEFILKDAEVQILVSESKFLFDLNYFQGHLFAVDIQLESKSADVVSVGLQKVNETNIAYIIYTSGSTGIPKGVPICHYNILNTILWRNSYYAFGTNDHVLQIPSFAFDSSVEDILCALTSGSTLVMISEEDRNDIGRLASVIEKNKVTNFLVTPSFYKILLQNADCEKWALRNVTIAGEAVSEELVKLHYDLLPDVKLINEYGPTENSVCSTVEILAPGAVVSIGKPINNVSIFILDKSFRLATIGMKGQIFIGGTGLFGGYVNRPDFNADTLISIPELHEGLLFKSGDMGMWLPDGRILFLGRGDSQVKINGVRVELGEIEAVINRFDSVKECKVFYNGNLLKAVVKLDFQVEPFLHRLSGEKRKLIDKPWNLKSLPNGMEVYSMNNAETNLTFQEIFEDKLYFRNGIYIGNNNVVVDVGANIGLFSIYVGCAFPDTKIFAIEPMPEVCERLLINANIYMLNLKALNVGLSNRSGIAEYHYYFNNTASSGLYANAEEEKINGKKVLRNNRKYATLSDRNIDELLSEGMKFNIVTGTVNTLSNIIKSESITRIGLLKIDVEKSELEVLQGIEPGDWPKIDQVVAEVHNINSNLAEIEKILRANGFSVVVEQPEILQDTNIYYVYARSGNLSTMHTDLTDVLPFNVPQRMMSAEAFKELLRKHCSTHLLNLMIPSEFLLIDEFPLTLNSKIDMEKCRHWLYESKSQEKQFVLPTNENELLIATTWAKVIGKEKIGIHENFFSLGGDSIKAIQIAAILNKEGLKVEIKDIFEAPTILELAKIVKPVSMYAEQGPVVGTVPLTPIQLEFFKSDLIRPEHFNQAILLSFSQRLDVKALEKTFVRLIEHHDALRSVLIKGEKGWVQTIKDTDITFGVEEYYAQDEPTILKITSTLNETIDLDNGPLVKVAVIHTGNEDRLFIVIHHMVVDGVSWRILLEDLRNLYVKAENNEELSLPPKTSSFKHWAEGIMEYAESHLVMEQLPYWKQIIGADLRGIWKQSMVDDGNFSYYNYRSCEFVIQESDTKLLLHEANMPFNTYVNELLLAALAITLSEIFSIQDVLIELEGHGRENIVPSLDITRTVGWFTSVYPVILHTDENRDVVKTIIGIKENIRKIPQRGVGFGILKYLSKKINLAAAHITFNYLGQFDEDFDDTMFRPASDPTGPTFNLGQSNKYILEFTAIVMDRQMSIEISYNSTIVSTHDAMNIADTYKQSILKVLDHCSNAAAGQLTPSDLSISNISLEELNTIRSLFEPPNP